MKPAPFAYMAPTSGGRDSPHYALIAEAMAVLGHPATRNRGTIGGSIAHADPAAGVSWRKASVTAILLWSGWSP